MFLTPTDIPPKKILMTIDSEYRTNCQLRTGLQCSSIYLTRNAEACRGINRHYCPYLPITGREDPDFLQRAFDRPPLWKVVSPTTSYYLLVLNVCRSFLCRVLYLREPHINRHGFMLCQGPLLSTQLVFWVAFAAMLFCSSWPDTHVLRPSSYTSLGPDYANVKYLTKAS